MSTRVRTAGQKVRSLRVDVGGGGKIPFRGREAPSCANGIYHASLLCFNRASQKAEVTVKGAIALVSLLLTACTANTAKAPDAAASADPYAESAQNVRLVGYRWIDP